MKGEKVVRSFQKQLMIERVRMSPYRESNCSTRSTGDFSSRSYRKRAQEYLMHTFQGFEDLKELFLSRPKKEATLIEMLSSSVGWLSELEIEDLTFIHQFQLNSFDDLNTKEISASHEQDLEHSFSTESYSSYPTLNTRNNNTTTTFSYSIVEDSKKTADRHAKQPKTDSLNSSTALHISNHDAPAILLSFGKSGSRPNIEQFYSDLVGTAQPKEDMISTRNIPFPSKNMISQFSSKVNQNSVYNTSQGTKRTTSQDHIIAERKRRQKLNQRFIALSAIVPGLKKTDKATVHGDAIKYLKTLKERVKSLGEQTEKKTMESVFFIKKSQLSADDDENSAGHSDRPLLEIEARISGKNILIRIKTKKF